MRLKLPTITTSRNSLTGKTEIIESNAVIETECIVSFEEALIGDEDGNVLVDKNMTMVELITGRIYCVPYRLSEFEEIIEQSKNLDEEDVDEFVKKLFKN